MPTGGPDSGESLEGSLRRLNQTAPDFPADAKPQATRPGGKMGLVLDMVSHANGATIDELATQAGWLTHTTRAALTRVRQRGFDIQLAAVGDRRAGNARWRAKLTDFETRLKS